MSENAKVAASDGPGEYGAAQLQVLKGLEAVRKRPGMYIGSTGPAGLHHCVFEVVDNSVDEAVAGACTEIQVELRPDGSVSVWDNGRGIPVDMHPTEKMPGVELALTTLHGGGKFDEKAYGGGTGGLHGVGVSVVNALSIWCRVKVDRDGKSHYIDFQRGKTTTPLKVTGKAKGTCTTVEFLPDPEIFREGTAFDYSTIAARLRTNAALNPGLRITLKDARHEPVRTETFAFDDGVADLVRIFASGLKPAHEDVVLLRGSEEVVLGEGEHAETRLVKVDVALQYNDGTSEIVHSFANGVTTGEGGTHLTGFRAALTRVVNEYLRGNGRFSNKQKEAGLTGEDLREGLTAVVAVRLRDPQYEGQTKAKLGSSEAKTAVERFVTEKLREYFEENPATARTITEKAILAAEAREAARKAKDLTRKKKSELEVGLLPGKLADCGTIDPDNNEIYIVEGDSAGGSAKQGRTKSFQAIMPLRGKVLNVERQDRSTVLGNEELRNLISVIGTGIEPDFHYDRRRYAKIIIMADADVDGAHIRTLLLTFFFRHMPELIRNGHIFLARPPLYRVYRSDKEEYYCYSDAERDATMERLTADGKDLSKYKIQRFKGLGEMNPGQLFSTTMDPKTRTLALVTIEDAIVADELFNRIMGKEVGPRRQFIEENALFARLDV